METFKIIILILAIANFSNWVTWGVDISLFRWIRSLPKPFPCTKCLSLWLSMIVFVILLQSFWAIPLAIVTSLVAQLIEDRLLKFY